MYTNKKKTLDDFVKNYRKGTFGLYFAGFTEKSLNKTPHGMRLKEAKECGAYNKYEGRVYTLTIAQNAASGVSYYACVKGEAKREGLFNKDTFDEDFVRDFPREKTYCEAEEKKLDNILLKNVKTDQRYLRLLFGRKPTKVKYFTFLDGHLATPTEVADILRYETPKSISKKQENIGLKNLVACRNFKVENVIFVAQGDDIYFNDRFGQQIDMAKIAAIFAK
jgi:hypothetical protein